MVASTRFTAGLPTTQGELPCPWHATLANKRLCDLAKLELCAGTKGEEEEEEEGEEEEKKKEEEEEEKKKEVVNKWSSSRRYRKHIKQEKD